MKKKLTWAGLQTVHQQVGENSLNIYCFIFLWSLLFKQIHIFLGSGIMIPSVTGWRPIKLHKAVIVLMCILSNGASLDAWWITVLGMLGMPVISFSFGFLSFLPPRPDHWPVLIFNFYFRLRRWPVSGPGDVTLIILIITIIIIMFLSVWPQLACVQGGQTSVCGQSAW